MIDRINLIVLDSAGIGALPDADNYGDKGSNTLKHIFENSGAGFSLPNMEKLGLLKILDLASNLKNEDILGCFGKMATKSPAKDTTAGHWEISGIILDKPLPTYPQGFPQDLINQFEKEAGVKVVGNCPASGTEIINKLGDYHIKTKQPILYTSADSVFQIAAHEEAFGLERLYKICEIARKLLTGKHNVGRVIARPFTTVNGVYTRTQNRKDYSLNPCEDTVLDFLQKEGSNTIAIGKIEDIFNFRGINKSIHTKTNEQAMQTIFEENIKNYQEKTLIFSNLADFDMLWGHRRDISAYAKGLKDFDSFIPKLIDIMTDRDMLIITADHGCDPSYKAHTDHTREYTPLLVFGKALKKNIDLGIRDSLSDIAQTIADIFNLPKMKNGKSFKEEIL
jgi:phosphopentomutase